MQEFRPKTYDARGLEQRDSESSSASTANLQRRRRSNATPFIRAAASSTVQPITIALPSGVALGKGHGPNYVGTVILDGPGRKPMRPIPVIAIPAQATPMRGSHRLHSSAADSISDLASATIPAEATPTDAVAAITATEFAPSGSDLPLDAPTATTADPNSVWIAAEHKPVFLALSAAGVVLLMLIAFMIGVCVFRKYPSSSTRARSLPAFLKRRRWFDSFHEKSANPGAGGLAGGVALLLDKHGNDGSMTHGKGMIDSLSPISPDTEKDAEGFEARFFTPSIGYSPDIRSTSAFLNEKTLVASSSSSRTTAAMHSKGGKGASTLPLSSKLISSVARGLAVSRGQAAGGGGPPPRPLKYEEIIASPVLASPSAIFSPDISTLSAHSPREVQRWTSFAQQQQQPVLQPQRHMATRAREAGGQDGEVYVIGPSGMSVRNDGDTGRYSPAAAGHFGRDLTVTNGPPLSTSGSSRSGQPSVIGLGLVERTAEDEEMEITMDENEVASRFGQQTRRIYESASRTEEAKPISIVQSDTADISEDDLSGFTMSQGIGRDVEAGMLPHEVSAKLPRGKTSASTDGRAFADGQPAPSLSHETIQKLTWRDVPEGSLRSGSPLRLDSCDNLAAISPSSSGMSLVGDRPAVPESMLQALDVGRLADAAGSHERGHVKAATSSDTTISYRRVGWHGTPGTTSSLASSSRRNMESQFPVPDARHSQDLGLLRKSTLGSASARSEDMIVLSGIALDGISPIDVPSYPIPLWNASSASAPALASYAATLATIAASDAAALAAQQPIRAHGADRNGNIDPNEVLASTPLRRSRSPQKGNGARPMLSPTPSDSSSSAHSVLLLREQRLRLNLETIHRAEQADALSLTPSGGDPLTHHPGQSGTDIMPNALATGSPGKAPKSSFSLTNLTMIEPGTVPVSTGPTPAYSLEQTMMRRSIKNQMGGASPGRALRNRNITPAATTLTTIPTTVESTTRTLMGPSSCGSTPASSRSMDTLDTRASSPTPGSFGHSFVAHEMRADAQCPSLDPTGFGNLPPVLTMLPAPPQLMSMRMGPHMLDGAMLALQEKEQQRLLAQHLLAHTTGPAPVNSTTAAAADAALNGTKKRKSGTGRRRNGPALTPSSSDTRSFYSHGSATASPTPRPTPDQRYAPEAKPATMQSRHYSSRSASTELRDSALSFANLARRSSFNGGLSGTNGVGHLVLSGDGVSGVPADRGSYVSPTLKLFHFYSSHTNSLSSCSGALHSASLNAGHLSSGVHSQTSSGSSGGGGGGGGLGLSLSLGQGGQNATAGGGGGVPGQTGGSEYDSRPASLSTLGMELAMPLPNFTAAVNGAAFVGLPKPLVRSDGVVDVFA